MTNAKKKETDIPAAPNLNDPLALAHALQPVWEKGGPLLARIYELISDNINEGDKKPIDPLNLRSAWASYMNYALARPEKTFARQFLWWNGFMTLWQDYVFKTLGENHKAQARIQPEKEDRRFNAPDWEQHPFFDFLKQAYFLTSRHLLESLNDFDDLDASTRGQLDFALRQYISALSPTNFLLTNPEVLHKTIETKGQNLIKGLENLIHDLERGEGALKISMTDYKAFEIGNNIAATKGQVVFKNDIMELIQYAPTTDRVYKEPLLIIPPWINKYYVLDLEEKKSFVKWLVDQGHSVFMISWVNPDTKMGHLTFENYIEDGFLSSLNEIEKITKTKSTNVIGYCIGGSMLSMGLSYLHSIGEEKRVHSATFLTTLIDFEDAGELKIFTTEPQIEIIEYQMEQAGGILPAETLQATFSLLRANDLIWSFVINNYMIGKDPFPFDLLYWNDDSTNLAGAMHSYYLRNMYLENNLKEKNVLKVKNQKIDVSTIKTPSYFLSCREDHIAPWRATYSGMKLFSGDKRFVLSASGHIAGVVNAPSKNKYCYWTSDKTKSAADDWIASSKEQSGSWWPDWQAWIEGKNSGKVKAKALKDGLYNAPGEYVKR